MPADPGPAWQDSVLICPPTYGMYSVSAQTNDVGIVKVDQTLDFDIDVPSVLEALKVATTKMVFLCSPGNPSCKLLDRANILTVLNRWPAPRPPSRPPPGRG